MFVATHLIGFGASLIDEIGTWDPLYVGTGIALSGNNLVATQTGAERRVNGTPVLLGKVYFELQYTGTASSTGLGVAISTVNLASTADNLTGAWIFRPDGFAYNPSTFASLTAVGASVWVGIAVDVTAGHIWWRNAAGWMGSGSPNPETGTSPTFTGVSGDLRPHARVATSGGTVTANFGGSAFAYTPPSGFTAP